MKGDFDIAVLGAGPAGVASGLELARHGYRVALLDRPRAFPTLEGLAPRALDALRHLGCERALNEVALDAQRSVYWNGIGFHGNREWLLRRNDFDRALLGDAREGGVNVLPGRVIRAAWIDTHWLITRHGPGQNALRSRYLIEARGRSAPRDRQGRRGPLTVALSGYWRLAGPGTAVTRVLPFSDGWLWFAARGDGKALVQLFVDARLPSRRRLAAHYARIVERISPAGEWLHGATLLGSPRARQAHTQCAAGLIDARSARVGDAALAVDPLSGHGIYQALAGALTLAPAINTLLARPADEAAARSYYQSRIGDDFQRLARTARDFYCQEQRWPEHDFWRRRQHWPDESPVHAAAGAAHIETRPVSCDGFVECRPVIVTGDQPRGVWHVNGVELVPLLGWWRQCPESDVGRAAALYAQRIDRAPEACGHALMWLRRHGLVP